MTTGAGTEWHMGPTADDPDPGKMWHYGCGGEVWFIEDGWICRKCGANNDHEEEPMENDAEPIPAGQERLPDMPTSNLEDMTAFGQLVREASDNRFALAEQVMRAERERRAAERKARLDAWLVGDVTVPRRVLYGLVEAARESWYDRDTDEDDEPTAYQLAHAALTADNRPWPS